MKRSLLALTLAGAIALPAWAQSSGALFEMSAFVEVDASLAGQR